MKIYHLFLVSLLFMMSCESTEETPEVKPDEIAVEQDEPTMEDLLANRWVYKERVNDEGTKRIEFGDDFSERIIKLESNGHFMIYDSITDENMVSSGVPRIAKKSSGQWEILGNKLILNHIGNDTIKKEELLIDKVENRELVTSTSDRGKVTYYALD